MRPSWVEIDLDAIAWNVRAIAELVAPASVCAVVKADAYGHGDVPVAETAVAAGADWLAVALVEEGIRLREAGIEAPILLLSEPVPEDFPLVGRWDLTPTVYNEGSLEPLVVACGKPIDVHLKVDTGMHRVGAAPETIEKLARSIAEYGLPLRIGGTWTHLAVAEEDEAFTELQLERFEGMVDTIMAGGVEVGIRHVANTAGALLHPRSHADMVRVGLGVYGLYPSPGCRGRVELHPAMRVVSHVTHVRRHPAGTRPSYGRRRPLPREGWVATVPIGYADGVPRLLSARGGEVLIGGRRHPLAGTVTMDQIVVDVGDHPVAPGDEVVLLGRQGSEEIGADEWAQRTETISYEIVCGIGPRPPPPLPGAGVSEGITSVPGVKVGHWTDPAAETGCTVIVFPEPNKAAVEIRGAAPGSRETALLQPGMRVEQVQAILLTGGSAFGLAAADGVVRALAADERGHPTPGGPVPIVPAAVVYDLMSGDGSARPGHAAAGEAAYREASGGPVVQGRVGAGTGTTVAKWRGWEAARPAGVGSHAVTAGGATVGALAVVNAVGDAFTLEGEPLTGGPPVAGPPAVPPPTMGEATTLAVVATDALLSRPDLGRLAIRGQDAFSVCLRPAHTRYDGDACFAVSCGMREGDLDALAEAAFEAVGRAIEAAVRSAAVPSSDTLGATS